MAKYYSPSGNNEEWDEGKQPEGYMTEEEWEKLHPEPTYIPTKSEQIEMLDAQYASDKKSLTQEYTDAQMHDDTETANALKAELAALDEWYDEEYRKIEEEEE